MPQHEMPVEADAGTYERIRKGETGIPGVKLPSNPTPLSAPQEQQVREIYYRNVRAKCGKEIEGTHFIFLCRYPHASKLLALGLWILSLRPDTQSNGTLYTLNPALI